MTPLVRLVWRHVDSGGLDVSGEGLGGTHNGFVSVDTARQLTRMFPELEFWLQTWDAEMQEWREQP